MSLHFNHDVQQAVLEGARDRLRSLSPQNSSEAHLVINSLRKSAATASLSHVLPLLDRIANALSAGEEGAVAQALDLIQEQLEFTGVSGGEERDEFVKCFIREAASQIDSIRKLLERLGASDDDRVSLLELRRIVHTLKGSAAMVGRLESSRAAHKFEELLQLVSQGNRHLDEHLLSRLHLGVDLLEQLLENPGQAKDIPMAALQRDTEATENVFESLAQTQASWVFDRLIAAAEEAAGRRGRPVTFLRSGDEVPMNRDQAAGVLESLLHLVRNAVAHGLEEPAQRVAQGKQPSGCIAVQARSDNGWTSFSVHDDGRGIDFVAVRHRVVEAGICSHLQASEAKRSEILDWIFLPGISTSLTADGVAGRGLGLDVVRTVISRMGGTISVETWPKEGTKFEVRLPI